MAKTKKPLSPLQEKVRRALYRIRKKIRDGDSTDIPFSTIQIVKRNILGKDTYGSQEWGRYGFGTFMAELELQLWMGDLEIINCLLKNIREYIQD